MNSGSYNYYINIKNIEGKPYENIVELRPNHTNLQHIPDILILEYNDYFRLILSDKIKYKNVKTNKTHTYKLDSAVLRNTERVHFTSYITLNGESYTFEGMHESPLEKYDWKKDINRDKNMSIGNDERHFNFMQGYQLLFYYREN
jgi:hypothetical protein